MTTTAAAAAAAAATATATATMPGVEDTSSNGNVMGGQQHPQQQQTQLEHQHRQQLPHQL